MNNQIKVARIVVRSLAIVMLISLLNYVADSIFSIRYITYEFNERLSPAACAAIRSQVENCQVAGVYNANAIINELPARYASIKTVGLLKLPSQSACLSVVLFDPVVAINDDKVLVENNRVVSAGYYADFIRSSLYAMKMADKDITSFSPELSVSIANAIQEKLFDHYTFNIASQDTWYLQDKRDPAFTVCCNGASIPTGKLYEKYAQLKKTVQKKELAKASWIADVRFKNQIVLSMSTGGHYGKGI